PPPRIITAGHIDVDRVAVPSGGVIDGIPVRREARVEYRAASEGYGGEIWLWGFAAEEPAVGQRTDRDSSYESQRWNQPLRPEGRRSSLDCGIHKVSGCAAQGFQC